MPIGNGDVGASVWLQPDTGALHLLISKVDAWNENSNLFKLGRVIITPQPSPFSTTATTPFVQTLHLANATVVVTAGDLQYSVWVDYNSNVVYTKLASTSTSYLLNVTMNTWRTSSRPQLSIFDPWYCGTYWTSADVVPASVPPSLPPSTIVQYHRNTNDTYFRNSMKQQSLESLNIPSPLALRTFGIAVAGSSSSSAQQHQLVRTSPSTLAATAAALEFTVAIAAVSAQTPTVEAWMKQVASLLPSQSPTLQASSSSHNAAWAAFWGRSHVTMTGNNSAVTVAAQIARFRFLQALQSRGGPFPIKFNGMLYTADFASPGMADERQWGGGNWWQNLRLPYWSMAGSADGDLMLSLFDYYLNMLPLAQGRTQVYFGYAGAFWPETQTIFGTYNQASGYGCAGQRAGFPPSTPESRWNRYNFQGGLDLTSLLLEHWAYYRNATLLTKYLPLADAVVSFYSHRWNETDAQGKLVMFPTQALETWQCITFPPVVEDCVTNDAPTIAGLMSVLERLLALPPSLTTAAQRASWAVLAAKVPPLPTQHGILWPGEKLPAHTTNSENVELYSVHPYRVITARSSSQQVSMAQATYAARRFPCNDGWCQDILDAALLGMTQEAVQQLVARVTAAPAKGYRFPAFSQHYQDYPPSADHLANAKSALQWMLLQPGNGTEVLLLPAWPCADWDVDFALAAPDNTLVELTLQAGVVTRLEVTPESRRADIKLVNCRMKA